MGKLTTAMGPTEVMEYARALEAHCNGTVFITAQVVTRGTGYCFEVGVSLSAPILVGPGKYLHLLSGGEWPNVDHKNYWSFLYAAIQSLDVALMEHWHQMSFSTQ